MTQPVNPGPQADPVTQPANVPPWERDGTPFDPQRAWSKLQAKEAELAKTKAQVTELQPYKAKVEDIENAAKTELQRAQDAAAAAQETAANATAALLRHQAANRPGKVLPAEWADRLRGSTKEELEADADKLLATFPQPTTTVPAQTAPVEALIPGAVPAQQQPDLRALIRAAGEKGDLAESLRLKNLLLQQASQKK